MQELWLNFSDPDGVTRRVRVEGERYVIGRQPDCDLAIPDSRLSRQHALIERFGSRYEISDLRSSNGTELRGSPVIDSAPIYDGDAISLGGLVVKAEISEPAQAAAASVSAAPSVPQPSTKPKVKENEKKGGIPLALLLAAPVLAVVLVVVAGGVIYLVAARGSGNVTADGEDTDDPILITKKEDDPSNKSSDDPPSNSGANTTSSPTSSDQPTNSNVPDLPPGKTSENAKIEANGSKFLRAIAQNDNNSFLTADQAQRVGAKVKQFAGSAAVADNIRSAKKNAAEIRSLAAKKGLKPQFLAVAAIAKLGTSRGDVLQTAVSMAEVIEKLINPIGTERGDDCLLTIAAYEQASAGETLKMRNMLQDLATKSTESSRTIRTIWFLHKEGKITPAEYDRALTFLAIGTIAQNPKDFNVNAEALDI